MMFVKLYQYFGIVGIASVLAWMTAIGMLVYYFRKCRYYGPYILIFVIAFFGRYLGDINSDRVSDIRVDETARTKAIEEERQRLRLAQGEGKIKVRFAEDGESDRLDEAGLKKEDAKQLDAEARANVMGDSEPAAADASTNAPAAGDAGAEKAGGAAGGEANGAAVGREGAPAASVGGEDAIANAEKQLDKSSAVESPEDGAVPAYRKKGVQARDAGKKKSEAGSEKVAEKAAGTENVRVMLEADVTMANKLDRLNLFIVGITYWVALGFFIWNYLWRFNTTFRWQFPLPLSGYWLDSTFPKSRSVFVAEMKEDVLRNYLEGVVRKGETFLYLGRKQLWMAPSLPRLAVIKGGLWTWLEIKRLGRRADQKTPPWIKGWLVVIVRGLAWVVRRIIKLLVAIARIGGKGGRRMAILARRIPSGRWGTVVSARCGTGWRWVYDHCADLRYLPIAAWVGFPLQKMVYGAEGVPSKSSFVFDSVWFNRYCVEVGERYDAERLMTDIVPYLSKRTFTRAEARQTVNVIWDFGSPPDGAAIKSLADLFKETNFKLMVIAPETPSESAKGSFDEVFTDVPLRGTNDYTADVLHLVSAEAVGKKEAEVEAAKQRKRMEAAEALRREEEAKAEAQRKLEEGRAAAVREAEAKAEERRKRAESEEEIRKAALARKREQEKKEEQRRAELGEAAWQAEVAKKEEAARKEAAARAEERRKRAEAEEATRKAEAAKKAELARKEAEAKAEEERKRAELEEEARRAEQAKREELAKKEAVAKTEEERRRAEAEEVAKRAEAAKRAELARNEAEAKAEEARKRAEAEEAARRAEQAEREELARKEAEARVAEARKRGESEEVARKAEQARREELARQAAEAEAQRKRIEAEEAARRAEQAKREELARKEEEARAAEQRKRVEAEEAARKAEQAKRQELARQEEEAWRQAASSAPVAGAASFTFMCPQCGQALAAEADWKGQQIVCPRCAAALVVPDPAGATTTPASVPDVDVLAAEARAAREGAEQTAAAAAPAGGFMFACPKCGQTLTAEPSWVGMQVTCPACSTAIVVPSPEGQTTVSGAGPASELQADGTFKFFCPNCQRKLSAETGWSGMEVTCPQCNQTMIVPPAPRVT